MQLFRLVKKKISVPKISKIVENCKARLVLIIIFLMYSLLCLKILAR